MANKTLTATVRLNTKSAEQAIDRLSAKIKSLNKAVNSVAGGNSNNLNKAVSKTAQSTALVAQNSARIAPALSRASQQANNFRNQTQRISSNTNVIDAEWREISSQLTRGQRILTGIYNAKNKVKTVTTGITTKVREWANNQMLVNNHLRSSNSLLSATTGKLKMLISTYLGIMGTKALINTSDVITSAENKLNNVTATQLGAAGSKADGTYSDATLKSTQQAMDKMYASSQKVRMSYTDMMSNVAKSMTLAGDAFQGNIDNAIRFQEIMAESYAIGGASAAEMSSSMYQLMQALGAGVLAGDELRSVREGAPLAYKAIEEFAQGVYKTEESLKELGSQGKITSDMVVAAIMSAGDQIDASFAQTQQTFAQTWEQVKNAAKKAFEPVARMLRDALNEAIDNGLLEKIETMFSSISKALQITFALISMGVNWIVENWSWLQYVVIGGLILMATYFVIVKGIAIASAIATAVAWAIVHWKLLLVIAVVASMIYIFYLWKSATIDTCTAIVLALAVVGLAIMLIGIMTGSLVVFIIGLIVLLAAMILQHLDSVMGAVYVTGAFIYNLVVGLINMILASVWGMVEPFAGFIEWLVNAFTGGFNGIGGAFANLLGQMISMLLSFAKPAAKIIDAVFGKNISGAIEELQGKVTSWGKVEGGYTVSRVAPTLNSITGGKLPDRIAYGDAWNSGKQFGADTKSAINGWGSKFQNGFGELSLDNIGKKLGLDFGGSTGSTGLNTGSGFPNFNDPAYALDTTDPKDLLGDIGDKLGGVKGDTGSIADSMELTEEDLSYLRDLANKEWVNKFTTASVKVDMSNYNTVNGDSDLDGIVTKLTDRLYEELDYMANGVYA